MVLASALLSAALSGYVARSLMRLRGYYDTYSATVIGVRMQSPLGWSNEVDILSKKAARVELRMTRSQLGRNRI